MMGRWWVEGGGGLWGGAASVGMAVRLEGACWMPAVVLQSRVSGGNGEGSWRPVPPLTSCCPETWGDNVIYNPFARLDTLGHYGSPYLDSPSNALRRAQLHEVLRSYKSQLQSTEYSCPAAALRLLLIARSVLPRFSLDGYFRFRFIRIIGGWSGVYR